VQSLYGPIADDLALVEDTLRLAASTEFAPLEQMLRSVLERGGKRLRPAIALLAGGFGTYDIDRQIPLAASIELLHTATLVHDDVIDAAPTRRGHPTANSTFDNAASVMLGDYMFAHAAELVARTGNIDVIRLFAQTLKVMATGELNQDLSAFDEASGNRRDYYQRISGKTASLFATAGAGGAMVSASDRDIVEALRSYGLKLGTAFQIVDDVLDFAGDEATMGKPVGSDLMAGTLTLPAILLMEDSPGANPVRALFATEGNDARQRALEEALARIRDGDILDRSMATADEWRDGALNAIASLPRNAHYEALEAIADFVTRRTF
jgi:geranylgeranyl pyrophosphate synthase